MSKMNICKNEENWTCGNNEVVVDNPLKQLLGERGTVKTIYRWIVHYWLVMWQMTSRNVKSPEVNDEYRRIVDSVSVI